MATRILGLIIALFGMFVFIANLMRLGDSEPAALNEPYTTGDVIVMAVAWLISGAGLYLLIKGSKRNFRKSVS
jgi:hypothetical protein